MPEHPAHPSPGGPGERVRKLRKQHKMSQAHLAGRDLSDSYISLIESGKRTPSPTVLAKLAERLNCSVDYLRCGIAETTVADLNTRYATARRALHTGHPDHALPLFADLATNPALPAVPHLHAKVLADTALTLEALGRFDEAITTLYQLPDMKATDEDGPTARLASPAADQQAAHRYRPRTLPVGQPPKIGWDRWADAQVALARCHRRNGHAQRAARTAQAAFAVAATAADSNDVAATEAAVQVGGALVEALTDIGDLMLARQTCTHVVRLAEHSGHPAARLLAYRHAAHITETLGDLDEAAHWADQALHLLDADEHLRAATETHARCAALLLRARPAHAERARDLLTQQLTRAVLDGGTAQTLADLAEAELLLGHPEQAAAHARHALHTADTHHPADHTNAPADGTRTPSPAGAGPTRAVAQALAVLGDACARLGQTDEAIIALIHRAELLEDRGSSRQAAHAWTRAADLLGSREGDPTSRVDLRRVQFYRRALAAIGVHHDD
ncbi:helix-turn-helix domain-containing protein [Actinomadura sp. SCN-SB]|uniref:helix-turn-helix domain-containing protein n=1 Tax=Actinomadura sp. SCN-SB TaxID=3373092 RepID=UPI0037508B52